MKNRAKMLSWQNLNKENVFYFIKLSLNVSLKAQYLMSTGRQGEQSNEGFKIQNWLRCNLCCYPLVCSATIRRETHKIATKFPSSSGFAMLQHCFIFGMIARCSNGSSLYLTFMTFSITAARSAVMFRMLPTKQMFLLNPQKSHRIWCFPKVSQNFGHTGFVFARFKESWGGAAARTPINFIGRFDSDSDSSWFIIRLKGSYS